MDFLASIKRLVECFEVIYNVIWYLLTNLLNLNYLTFSTDDNSRGTKIWAGARKIVLDQFKYT